MTVYAAPICLGCKRYVKRMEPTRDQFRTGTPPVTGYCEAYPEDPKDTTLGIPVAIWQSAADHREPFKGDHGKHFKAQDEKATEYANLLFRARDEDEAGGGEEEDEYAGDE